MLFVSTDRGMGKTTTLLHWFLTKPEQRYVLVADERRRHYLIAQATQVITYAYELSTNWDSNTEEAIARAHTVGLHIATFQSFKSRWLQTRRDEIEIAVDDLEHLLQRAIGCVPDVATGSMVIVPSYELDDLRH